jgi:hypothetical protein
MIFGLSLFSPLPGLMQRAEDLVLCPGNGPRVSARVAPQRCPILCTSVTILSPFHSPRWSVFRYEFLMCSCSSGRFFEVKVVGFSGSDANFRENN